MSGEIQTPARGNSAMDSLIVVLMLVQIAVAIWAAKP